MRSFAYLALMGVLGSAVAQDVSVCDKYTTALFPENNSTNQYTLLTLLVNTVVIGNYTQPNKNAVPGILAKGEYMGTEVNLLPYFDGTLASSNRGGSAGVSVNFLDDGGADPLTHNMPSNGKDSQQYKLLTHLYQFFGKLLGCSTYGTEGFPKYSGHDMASSHAFMDLTPAELGYFISQVGLAATSFGVSTEDVTAVAGSLNKLFGYRCSPPAVVIPEMGATLNSICQAEECPLDAMATCAAYPSSGTVSEPATATPTGSGMPTKSMTASSEYHCKESGPCAMPTKSVTSSAEYHCKESGPCAVPTKSIASSAEYHCKESGPCAKPTTVMTNGVPVVTKNSTQTEMPTGTNTGAAMFTGAAGQVGAGVGAVVGALALGFAF